MLRCTTLPRVPLGTWKKQSTALNTWPQIQIHARTNQNTEIVTDTRAVQLIGTALKSIEDDWQTGYPNPRNTPLPPPSSITVHMSHLVFAMISDKHEGTAVVGLDSVFDQCADSCIHLLANHDAGLKLFTSASPPQRHVYSQYQNQ